jgi:hypothetical protein
MLEYLLLRPDDSPLFDNGRGSSWAFVVLDEAHQYRGARGIEMAMLLRRLKQRIREGGGKRQLCCIATSATLAGGEEDKEAIARFATDLLEEPFASSDVILGQVEPIEKHGSASLASEDYRYLNRALDEETIDREKLLNLRRRLGLPLSRESSPRTEIGALLAGDARASHLRDLIQSSPHELSGVAEEIFPEVAVADRLRSLTEMVEVLAKARSPLAGAPLLSPRYHLFLRSLEGAFVSYYPEKRVALDRGPSEEGGAAFEVALCRECGQHYFVAPKNFRSGKLTEPDRDPSSLHFGATFFRPVEGPGDVVQSDDAEGCEERLCYLCTRCGELSVAVPKCGHNSILKVVRQESPRDEDRADQMIRCSACGYNAAGRDPVREVVHGTDGPHAVIATTLYQYLPDNRKKVLAFADGRQEAAFFAWYLENSYKDILSRNLVLSILRALSPHTAGGLSLREIKGGLRDAFRERRLLPPAMGDLETRREAWLWIYREFLTDSQRISLEGVGAVRWRIEWPEWIKLPELFRDSPWDFSETDTHAVMLLLLDSLRMDSAVDLRTEPGIPLTWSDLGLHSSQLRIRLDPPGGPGIRSWDGKMGRRARFLAKILTRKGMSETEARELAVRALRGIWERLGECDRMARTADDRLLVSIGDTRRLNPEWYRALPTESSDQLYECDTCGRLNATNVAGVCARSTCPGEVRRVALSELDVNHYRNLYEDALPSILRVEEHTAQLEKEKAREFQREFREGKIHVLSCSTTFELGVDLGDLDTIFLRNMPPEAFNYAQRVGRAGRRTGFPGFAITYCRRGPHDLYYFSNPSWMLNGRTRAPVLRIANSRIALRHAVALILSEYFRAFPDRFRTVVGLFRDFSDPQGCADLREFLEQNRNSIRYFLTVTLPPMICEEIGVHDGRFVDQIVGYDSRFARAEAEVSSDYKSVKALEIEARDSGRYEVAAWASARGKTIAEEDVLSFLSRKAVIPKYGFPVDVVELDPQRTAQNQAAYEVMLQRDLSIAISEFAPTSKLVANKRTWTSYGLKRVAEREWPRRFYKRCHRHNVFCRWKEGEPEPPMACGDLANTYEYVIPQFGFVTDRAKPKEPSGRPARVFSTRPYFAGLLNPEPGMLHFPKESPLVTIKRASPGLMTVLCEGRRGEGFYVCKTCGAGFRKRETRHKSPAGQDCRGKLDLVSLGHEFVTDVVELRFHRGFFDVIDQIWFGYSLAYALIEGIAEFLEIPSTDLSATVAHGGDSPVSPIILYDNVPGGAGLVARLEAEESLKASVEAARNRVSGKCGCDSMTSCYGCLRSYRNQFAHQYLQRGPVCRYLDAFIGSWR